MGKVNKKKNEISEKLKSKGYSVRGWARVNGFNPVTVFQLIYKQGGYKGIRGDIANKIKKSLEKEGIFL